MNVRDSRVYNYSSAARRVGSRRPQKKGVQEVCPPRPCTLLGVSPTRKGCSNSSIATVYGSSEALLVVEPLLSEALLILRRRVAAAASTPRSPLPDAPTSKAPRQAGNACELALGARPTESALSAPWGWSWGVRPGENAPPTTRRRGDWSWTSAVRVLSA